MCSAPKPKPNAPAQVADPARLVTETTTRRRRRGAAGEPNAFGRSALRVDLNFGPAASAGSSGLRIPTQTGA